jgi:aspartate/methionine/tyrosine aminotransferase
MRVETFQMERMQSEWENRVAHNLSESGVQPMTVEELLDPSERDEVLRERLLYVQSNGSDALRSAVAALYPGAEARNVVITNGTAEANYISIWRLVEPGDEVVMMLPNYMQIWGIVRSQGATVVPWPLREERGWAPDLDELSLAFTPRTRLVVVCNPNNPTGSILARDAMREIVARTARQGAWLLVDEVYRGAEREGEETPSFWGSYERLLVTSGLSKAYALPGLRIGWVVGPEETVAELWGRKDYLTISPGALSDVLARKALRPDVRARVLARTRGILRANYPILEDWVGRQADAFHMVPPRAGAIAYLRYARAINSTKLVTRLRDEYGVLIVPGDHFGMDRYLRIGFGNEPEELRAGLARIEVGIAGLPAARPVKPGTLGT